MSRRRVARLIKRVKAMSRYIKYIVLLCVAMVTCLTDSYAQNMPERGLVRKGNRQFSNQRYEQSADSYQQALVYDSTSFAAKYNLGNAMFRPQAMERGVLQRPEPYDSPTL